MSINISQGGDPGKLAYLHNPNFQCTPVAILGSGVKQKTFCPGCYWGEGRPHENSPVCKLWGMNDEEWDRLWTGAPR